MQDRYFWIATVTAFIGIVSFAINVKIKGYIPFFIISSYPSAYVDFYTRYHTFVVASMVVGGFSYYILKSQHNLSKVKKFFLTSYLMIFVFILPILLVQRGTFINAALILATVIYLMSNRKFHVLLLCVIVIFSVYLLGSSLRGYSDKQLGEFFPPKEIVVSDDEVEYIDQIENVLPFSFKTFKLPPKAAFLYSYLTVSHDNFNSAVEKNKNLTWGVWQLEPFNVILRSEILRAKIDEAHDVMQQHLVLPHLNTFNLISKAFYDFGVLGVIALISVWSFFFGIVENFAYKYKGPFSYLAYGVIMTPVAMCFMNPWMSIFPVWLMWGTILLMFLAGSISINANKRISKENI